MNYIEAVDYIDRVYKYKGNVYGLERIKRLLTLLGNPQKGIFAFHVAGTNGKGSIAAYIEQAFLEKGIKTGRYLSPAVFDFREKWQINGEYIDEETLAHYITEVAAAVESFEPDNRPTGFEIETAVAFLCFKELQCEVILIECGLGGEEDGTNVFDVTPIDILASVSRDHMQFLGNTIQEITVNKLGIVKNNDVLVRYPFTDSEIVKEYIFEKNLDVKDVCPSPQDISIMDETTDGADFAYKGEMYHIPLAGRHQIYNAVTAIEALLAYNDMAEEYKLEKLTANDIKNGLSKVKWPGRMQKLSQRPLVYADGAHNEDAWVCLADTLRKHFTDKKIIFIIGVLKDKEYDRMIDILQPYMDFVNVVTPINNARAMDGESLCRLLKERGVESVFRESYAEAYEASYREALEDAENTVVMITGSLSFIGEMVRISKAFQG